MFFYFALFVIGVSFGSFINALEYRAEKGLAITGRSFCPKCKHKLSWYDLIPVVSWLSLGKRCRYCKAKISWQYPLIEVVAGILFAAVSFSSGLAPEIQRALLEGGSVQLASILKLILLLTIVGIMVLLALYDAKTGYILSAFAYAGIFLTFLYLLFDCNFQSLSSIGLYFLPYFLSGGVVAGAFLLITMFSKEKLMGAGDAELVFLIGFFLGWPTIFIALFVSIIAGAIFSLYLVAKKGANLKSEVPFGPFLVTGFFVAVIFGEKLFDIYLRIFLGL